jgi:hypothetical protein
MPRQLHPAAALPLLAVLAACGSSTPTPAPQLYYTCGDPVCREYRKPADVPLCTSQKPGDACASVGTQCDPVDTCNRLLVCATTDPRTQPGGCPISSLRFKTGVSYLGQADLDRYYDELRRIRLATYQYRDRGPADRRRLGFLIEDQEPSVCVDPERDMVDLYGYTSLAVAALQVQARQIEALQREVADLRRQVQRRAGGSAPAGSDPARP